jgi:hypothetical protein
MKNTVKILGLTLGFILSWQSVNAKTIVISDIDDTIKLSHILDKTDAFKNVFRTENVFLGMNTAYQLLKAQDESIEFFYVSNGPKIGVGELHKEFLEGHVFPDKQNAYFRSIGYPDPQNPEETIWGLDPEHKVKTISAIIESRKPDLVILVGDNGEQDPFTYDTIVKKFPNTKILSQIHMPYYTDALDEQYRGKALQGQQEGFATSYDMILSWLDKGIIQEHAVVFFEEEFRKALAKEDKFEDEGAMALPDWTDCRNVNFDGAPILKLPTEVHNQALLTLTAVQERCLIPAIKN